MEGRGATLLSVLAFATLAPLACGSDRDATGGGPDDFNRDSGAEDGPRCGLYCSRDLKKVLSGCEGESGTVAEECSPDQGCGGSECVSACEAAARAKGSAGCGFWMIPPDDIGAGGFCYATMIANTWDRPVTITAEWGKDPLDISEAVYTASRTSGDAVYTKLDGPLPPGQVGIVFLSQIEGLTGPKVVPCPKTVKAAVNGDPVHHGTARMKAFHIETDAPVAAYTMFPYGGATSEIPSATLLLPDSSYDRSYVAVTIGKFGDPENTIGKLRTLQFIGMEDGTEVSVRPNFDISRGADVEPAVAGETTTWTLQRGEVLQFTQEEVKSGSPIQANKPVGLFGASPCAFLPGEIEYCDTYQQQIPGFAQLGTEYALVPYRPRIEGLEGEVRENVAWSLVGAVDDTELTWSPSKPPGAPEKLSAGQALHFMTDAITSVKSQDKKHPFHAAVYMTGSTYGGGKGAGKTFGDPDFVNVPPSDQFLDRYVFFADYTFPETSLTVVRRRTSGEFKPVTLECGGEISGWQPIGDGAEFEFAWVVLTTGFLPQKIGSGTCGYGRHVAESDGPFMITVWGIGKDASYGYVGGMGSRSINDAPSPIIR